MLIDLADAETTTSGGKAAAQARLLRAGRPVPPGFVIPADAADGSALEAEVSRALTALGGPFAVRSSAADEDTEDATAAGQHDTFLGLVGLEEVLEAVRACRGSVWSERAVAYRRSRGDAGPPAIAVLVQRLVSAGTAGVLFTGDQVRIEASWGLGENVVSGRVTPDSWVVTGDAVASRTLGSKEIRSDWREGRVVGTPVPAADRDRYCLDDDMLVELARSGRDIAGLLGAPQDIEWAIDGDGRLWFLQARPVTAALPGRLAASTGDARSLSGTPASSGVASGTARVVGSLADFARVHPGDVLVCETTDPAWTPLFGVAVAVVTATGGMLSHAAIVAREAGIPAVVAVGDAMTAIPDGAAITVDGDAGLITLR